MSERRIGKWLQFGAVAGLTLGLGLGVGSGASARTADESAAQEQAPAFEEVDSFSILSRLHSWQAVDDDTVIVWATAFQPYLVELAYPSHDLRFAEAIGGNVRRQPRVRGFRLAPRGRLPLPYRQHLQDDTRRGPKPRSGFLRSSEPRR